MFHGYGFGFRGASCPWPYVGRGRGGLPRCWYPGVVTTPPYGASSLHYPPRMTRKQELDFLREEANTLREQLGELESTMKELEAKEE